LTILVLFVAGPAHGQGLLNKLYARFDAGYTTYGDEVLKEAGAWSTGVSAMANVPVMEYVDVFAHYTFSTFFGDPPEKPFHRELSNFAFDEISHAIGVGVVGHVAPEDQIDLFLSASVTGVDQSTGDESINPVTIRISLGSELRSDSPLSVRPYVSYLSIDTNFQGNDNQRLDDGELGFDASYWLYSHLFLGFSAGVTFDDKNVDVTAGAGISL
jgi:hypothetical protein